MTLYLGNNLISGVAYPTEPTRNLGQIIESIVPLTDAGLHLLDGALIYGSGIYSAFVDAIADLVTDYPDLFETEANWQSAVTTYGVCGKFVYDSVNNTVRLPKITGILEGTTDVTALGDLIEQYVKLPNITGTYVANNRADGTSTTGAFQGSGEVSGSYPSGTSSNTRQFINFNASYSSSVYSGNGTDTKIQPQAIKVLYYIVIATTTKTEIEVDIDEIATDLNGKADVDLTNINSSCKALDGQWVYVAQTISSATAVGTYTIDISSYLPDDNYLYEVEISQQALGNPGVSFSTFSTAYIWTRGVYNTGATYAAGSNILCVGTDRKITMEIGQVAFQANSVTLGSYRRIGTNQ